MWCQYLPARLGGGSSRSRPPRPKPISPAPWANSCRTLHGICCPQGHIHNPGLGKRLGHWFAAEVYVQPHHCALGISASARRLFATTPEHRLISHTRGGPSVLDRAHSRCARFWKGCLRHGEFATGITSATADARAGISAALPPPPIKLDIGNRATRVRQRAGQSMN